MTDLSVPNFCFFDLAPDTGSFLEDVHAGLNRSNKSLPAKYFYDDEGSRLFDKICDLPEYYPTRTEITLMRDYAGQMAARFGPKALLIEYGSGSSTKSPVLIDALQPAAYVPIDISRDYLSQAAATLARARPGLPVRAICADYTKPFLFPDCSDTGYQRKLVYFPGSTIGNFDSEETLAFLRHAAVVVGQGGGMLVGVDLKKDRAILDAAYNDAAGVTAAFNMNVLSRINRELGGNIDLAGFRHHAFYNEELGRIEMHLLSLRKQSALIVGRRFNFAEGETIHTEISCKYGIEEFQSVARAAGYIAEAVWTDEQRLFSVHFLRVEQEVDGQ
ncbi:MAG: L-histidine N(alpha)-methyltransferase [Burkholderiales bacterium]